MNVESTPFGTTRSGQAVTQYTLTNDAGMEVGVLDYGGIITKIIVPAADGTPGDVVLGFDNLADYQAKSPFFGCITGRVANRLAQARFTLDGTEYQLARNDGQNHLHGGPVGFDKVMWDAEPFTADDGVGVKLHYLSPDGDQGFPGALDTTVTYTLSNDNALRVDYAATTDAPTILNLTNHTYFNLAGGGNVGEHVVELDADAFTPVDSTLIPNGELRDVTGTPHDFRTPTAIGARIDQDDEQLKLGGGYDHNWVVRGTPGELRRAARVEAPSTGRVLEVYTTQPGVQLYTGNMMPTVTGKGGQEYTRRTGFCLETQHFPDAPNQPTFPSIVLRPGEQFHETTVFKFDVTE